MNTIETLKATAEEIAAEFTKFDSGNNLAGTRARKACQVLIKAAREIRKQIQEVKASRKAGKA